MLFFLRSLIISFFICNSLPLISMLDPQHNLDSIKPTTTQENNYYKTFAQTTLLATAGTALHLHTLNDLNVSHECVAWRTLATLGSIYYLNQENENVTPAIITGVVAGLCIRLIEKMLILFRPLQP